MAGGVEEGQWMGQEGGWGQRGAHWLHGVPMGGRLGQAACLQCMGGVGVVV